MHWSRRPTPEVIDKVLDNLDERINRTAPEEQNHRHQGTQQRQNLMRAHLDLNLSRSWFVTFLVVAGFEKQSDSMMNRNDSPHFAYMRSDSSVVFRANRGERHRAKVLGLPGPGEFACRICVPQTNYSRATELSDDDSRRGGERAELRRALHHRGMGMRYELRTTRCR